MKLKTALIPALAAALLLPGVASADSILDTGTPPNLSGPVLLESSQWFAGEFEANSGETITSLSAYLESTATTPPGTSFTFDIYSASSFLGVRTSQLQPVYSTTATFEATGWNTAAANWMPTATGDYWLTLQNTSTGRNAAIFDVPLESGSATGTVPALAFAYYGPGTSSEFTTSNAPAIGLEVTAATAVPSPPSVWLFGASMLAGLAATLRRGRRYGTA